MLTDFRLERFPENISIWNKRPNYQNWFCAVVLSITELVLKKLIQKMRCIANTMDLTDHAQTKSFLNFAFFLKVMY